MWKAHIVLGLTQDGRRKGSIDVPVKLYSAVQDKSIHFRLLDAKRNEPVKQQLIDPSSGDVVPYAETKRAYQSKAGLLVILDA
jgi:DNA end-binding protein Ku